jgi:hypothetical protein
MEGSSVTRRLIIALAMAALVAAMAPGVASGSPPIGGCPTGDGAGWYLVLPIHQPQAADHNGDQYLCKRDLSNGTFTFRDRKSVV